MFKRFIHAVAAAIRTFRSDLKADLQPRAIRQALPEWGDGTDYDIPTFLRRRTG